MYTHKCAHDMDILFAVVYYFLTILWATVTLLRTALVICTNPVKAFKKTRRDGKLSESVSIATTH